MLLKIMSYSIIIFNNIYLLAVRFCVESYLPGSSAADPSAFYSAAACRCNEYVDMQREISCARCLWAGLYFQPCNEDPFLVDEEPVAEVAPPVATEEAVKPAAAEDPVPPVVPAAVPPTEG